MPSFGHGSSIANSVRKNPTGELFALCVALAGIALLTLWDSDKRAPHADEIFYAETPTNMARGDGPIHTAHPTVVPGDPSPMMYVPFTLSQAIWIQVFGSSRISIRAFAAAISTACALGLWWYLWKSRILQSSAARLFVALSLPLLPSTQAVIGINRYDMIAMLGFVLAMSATLLHGTARFLLLAVAGFLVGADGFQAAIIAPVLAVLVAWRSPKARFIDAAVVTLGVIAGLALSFLEMFFSGTLSAFRDFAAHNGVQSNRFFSAISSPFLRHSTFFEVCILAVALACCLRRGNTARTFVQNNASVITGYSVLFVVPFILGLAGRYNQTYAWLCVLPVFFIACQIISDGSCLPWQRYAVVLLLVLDALLGLPVRLAFDAVESDANSYSEVASAIANHIRDTDVVFACNAAWYPVKSKGVPSFFGPAIRTMRDDQLSQVTVAVLTADEKPSGFDELKQAQALARLGGDWIEVDRVRVPRGALRARIPPPVKEQNVYDFSVFRRQ
jgi:hypothetical protein